MKKTAVIGIGNLLLKDDGAGIHILKQLEREPWHRKVEVIDGGTCIFDLMDAFITNEKVILLDSVKGGHRPGTIYKLSPEELGSFIKKTTSLHDVQVLDVLQNVNHMGYFPEVVIIGIEPEEVCFDLQLSPTVKKQLPEMLSILKNEVLKEEVGTNA